MNRQEKRVIQRKRREERERIFTKKCRDVSKAIHRVSEAWAERIEQYRDQMRQMKIKQEPIWEAITRLGEEAAKEEEPEAEKEKPEIEATVTVTGGGGDAEKETCEGCAFVVEPLEIEGAYIEKVCLKAFFPFSAATSNKGGTCYRPVAPPEPKPDTCEGCKIRICRRCEIGILTKGGN